MTQVELNITLYLDIPDEDIKENELETPEDYIEYINLNNLIDLDNNEFDITSAKIV